MTGKARAESSFPQPRGVGARRAAVALLLAVLQIVVGLPARASGRELPPPATPVVGPVGSLVVLTDPPGVRAWIGDRFLGTTPVHVDSLAPGRVEMVLAPSSTDAGWRRPHLLYADVQAGAIDTVRIDLRRDNAKAFAGGEPVPVHAELPSRRSSLSRVGTMLPVAALCLGAAGVWSRHIADTAYRDYRHASDRELRNDRYRRAQRLDHVSVACWIGAEVCLAGAAWVWLHGDDRTPVSASVDGEGTVRLGVRVDGGNPPPPAQQEAP